MSGQPGASRVGGGARVSGRPRERGAALIQVTVAILGLIAFTIFVIDYGVVWVARAQAQNAADAAALAGAVSLAYEDAPGHATATARAIEVAAQNPILGEAPVVLAGDVTYPVCPDGTNACVRVDVYRSADRGSALPSFFGPLLGINSQRVRATATAQAALANASDCLKPWAVPDKWVEINPDPAVTQDPWNSDYEYNVVDRRGEPIPNPDYYSPPTPAGPGTGFTVEVDYGTQLRLKPGNPHDSITPGWFLAVDLPMAGGGPITGGDRYRTNIAQCNGMPVPIGSMLQNEPGNMIGPTAQGVRDLIALDPLAAWTGDETGHVTGGCMAAGTCTLSPRMVALPIFNVDTYLTGRASGRVDILVVNILGFFIEGLAGNDVLGRLTHYPGCLSQGASTLNPNSAFQRVILLVQ